MNPIEYADSPLPEWFGDTPVEFGESSAPALSAYRISSAPPGKHALDECDEYERLWRQQATDVIADLKGDALAVVVWAHGPFESDGILPLMAHVDGWNKCGLRYHVEGFTYPGGVGYWSTWFSLELNIDELRRIISDSDINLEFTRLNFLLCPPDCVTVWIPQPITDVDLSWVLENDAICMISMRHFEGLYAVGAADVLGAGVDRLRNRGA